MFPSPAGVFFISSNLIYTAQRFDMMFPSPAGVFFISSLKRTAHQISRIFSFRPLPGSFLFHLLLFRLMKKGSLFPSPAGAFLFHRMTMTGLMNIWKKVSVPCRGLFYFITGTTSWLKRFTISFRPLPGSFLFHHKA